MNRETSLPPLTPNISQWMTKLAQDREKVQQLIQEHGSPLHVHHLDAFNQNVQGFLNVMEKHHVAGLIQYARKVNRCVEYVDRAIELGIGIDVSSSFELEQTLERGCPSEKLIYTAAGKRDQDIALCVRRGVVLVLDHEEEIARAKVIAAEVGKRALIALRLAGFELHGKESYSRFGVGVNNILERLSSLLHPEDKDVRLIGLHFHLNGYSREERGQAGHICCDLTEELRSTGYPIQFLDIGGGMTVNYLQDEREWNVFQEELRKAIRQERPPITFRNHPLGAVFDRGEFVMEPNLYPFFHPTPKDQYLEQVFLIERKGSSLAERLRTLELEVRIEPGRALLDQCGVTLAEVLYTKHDIEGELLVGVDINSTQHLAVSADHCLDPIFIGNEQAGSKTEGYLVGTYCMESDLIVKRKLCFPTKPQIGDVFMLINTAGYLMHLLESPGHQPTLPKSFFLQSWGRGDSHGGSRQRYHKKSSTLTEN